MSVTPIFCGSVSPVGSLVLDERRRFHEHLREFAGKRVEVVVRRRRSQRTHQANRYYFGVVVAMLAEEFGYDKQEMHDVLAMKFLRVEDCPVTGAPRRKRTPNCDTAEFAEYVDACIRLGAEHGVVVPEPSGVDL